MRKTLVAAAAASIAAGSLLLTACGSDTTPAPAPSTSTSDSSSAPVIGGDPATWAPVEIDPLVTQTEPVILVPNQRVVFTGIKDTKGYKVLSQDATVVEPVNPSGSGGDATALGLIALAPGESVVQLELDGATVYEPITIQVVPNGGSAS